MFTGGVVGSSQPSRPSEKGRETGLKPAGGIAPSGFPAPAAVLARAAAAFGVKVGISEGPATS